VTEPEPVYLAAAPTEQEYEELQAEVDDLKVQLRELQQRKVQPQIERVVVEKDDSEIQKIRERLVRNLEKLEKSG
jgi:hypothetical protein